MTPHFPITLGQGRYIAERVFADGGMGVILEARDTRCADNRVLLKTSRYDHGPRARLFRYTRDEALRHIESFRKILEWEKRVLVRFKNEGINNLPSANHWFVDRTFTLKSSYEGRNGRYELPEEVLNSEPYLVMELIPGQILEKRAMDEDFREKLEDNLLSFSREMLTILIRMHRPFDIAGQSACFLYQDLKPENVIVSHTNYFTLIDFGGVTLRLNGRTTEPTAGCITTGYAAPEAADGQEAYIDAQFDVYTLGATLWHCVTGVDPRDLPGEFPTLDPSQLQGRGISQRFQRIIARALARNPAQRYATAAAMRRDVIDALREHRL